MGPSSKLWDVGTPPCQPAARLPAASLLSGCQAVSSLPTSYFLHEAYLTCAAAAAGTLLGHTSRLYCWKNCVEQLHGQTDLQYNLIGCWA